MGDLIMELAAYVEANKQRLIERWKRLVVDELRLELDESELVDDVPEVLDDVVEAAAGAAGGAELRELTMESGRKHGRQRMSVGVNLGELTRELALVGEAVLSLAEEDHEGLSCAQMRLLLQILSKCTEASVDAYVEMRDQQFARQATQHFSFIAHEIRSPLQGARLATSLIAAGRPDQRTRYLNRLERSLAELSSLVDNSLSAARFLGEAPLRVERIDARALVLALREQVATLIEARRMELTVDAEEFEFEGDRRMLSSALTNLLENAIKFTPDCGAIEVRATSDGGKARFEIADRCGGIAAERLDHLFEPFVQARPDLRGFGLGLAIVQQVVDAHRGAVHVENHPGHGCVFVIELPLVHEPEDPELETP